MKTIFALLFLSVAINAQSQIPDYFEADNEWRCSFVSYINGEPCENYEDYVYYIHGDTLIDSHTYKKLGKRYYQYHLLGWGAQQGDNCDDTDWGDYELYKFVRQSNDSIFHYVPGIGMDQLLISYNVNIGDTLTNTSFIQGTHVVQDIDLISINGQWHRVFVFDSLNNNYIIEGVCHNSETGDNGEMFSVFGFYPGLGFTYGITCYSQNGTTVWTNPTTTGTCNYLNDLGIEEQEKLEEISLSPNPSSDQVLITSQSTMDRIEIRSINGQLVYSEDCKSSNCTIQISEFDSGMYFVKAIMQSGGIGITRLLKL